MHLRPAQATNRGTTQVSVVVRLPLGLGAPPQRSEVQQHEQLTNRVESSPVAVGAAHARVSLHYSGTQSQEHQPCAGKVLLPMPVRLQSAID